MIKWKYMKKGDRKRFSGGLMENLKVDDGMSLLHFPE